MILRFNKKEVDELINWQLQNKVSETEVPYASYIKEKDPKANVKCLPSLEIVGDDGVYILNHSTKTNSRNVENHPKVVYAEECNPKTMEFDDWWEVKNNSFGGDDGVELLPIEWFKKIKQIGKFYMLEVSPNTIGMKGIK